MNCLGKEMFVCQMVWLGCVFIAVVHYDRRTKTVNGGISF